MRERREKGLKRSTGRILAALCCLALTGGCGGKQAGETGALTARAEGEPEAGGETDGMPETGGETDRAPETGVETDGGDVTDKRKETGQAQAGMPVETDGLLEVYTERDNIPISSDIMIAEVSPGELLKGSPVIYDRFRVDGWIFEWMLAYYGSDFLEDSVLVISREDNGGDTQVIHVQGKGDWGTWVSVDNKFEYMDVNFDGRPDLLICTGHHGNQGFLTYYCFLQTEDGFSEAPTFTGIPNPAVDEENRLILSQWRNWAASHSWAEYRYQDGEYILSRELKEELMTDEDVEQDGKEVWVWTVNGEEVGRSDEMTDEEVHALLFDEDGEWGIAGDRWRTIYNNGLTADYSIYGEP